MKTKTKYLVILIALLFISIFSLRTVDVLMIKDVEKDSILFAQSVKPGFEFATLIRHSVQKTPVYEYYRVEEDETLTVTRTELQDLGWGMPSILDHKVEFKDNYMIMNDINRNLSFLPFRVNYIAEPYLIIGDKKINLMEHVEDNQLIHVYIQRMWNASYILRGKFNVF